MSKICIYCASNFARTKPHSLLEASESMFKIFYYSIHPTALSRKDYLCLRCYTNHQGISENDTNTNVVPVLEFGHKHVCHACGTSTKISKTHPVPLECPESVILSCSLPHLVKYLKRVCAACWITSKRKIKISNVSSEFSETTQKAIHYIQANDMIPAPKPKLKPEVPEIPVPGVPEDPLPGFPVPGFPDVAIPIVPEFPMPKLPELPPLPGDPASFLPDFPMPGLPVPVKLGNSVPVPPPLPPDNLALVQYKTVQYIIFGSYKRAASTSCHCIFQESGNPARLLIPTSIKSMLLRNHKIYISRSGRVCKYNLRKSYWNKIIYTLPEFTHHQIDDMFSILDNHRLDLTNLDTLPSNFCDHFYGINYVQFLKLIKFASMLRRQVHSPKKALSICMVKLKTGQSYERSTRLFNISSSTLEVYVNDTKFWQNKQLERLNLSIQQVYTKEEPSEAEKMETNN